MSLKRVKYFECPIFEKRVKTWIKSVEISVKRVKYWECFQNVEKC